MVRGSYTAEITALSLLTAIIVNREAGKMADKLRTSRELAQLIGSFVLFEDFHGTRLQSVSKPRGKLGSPWNGYQQRLYRPRRD